MQRVVTGFGGSSASELLDVEAKLEELPERQIPRVGTDRHNGSHLEEPQTNVSTATADDSTKCKHTHLQID